jgi:nucleoside-diphosphate-sugar epimerase
MTLPVFDRILVTGGTGFLGRYVLERLVLRGCRPRATTFGEDKTSGSAIELSGVDLVESDLTDRKQAKKLVEEYRPQTVIHLAGTTGHNDPKGERCHRINYEATVNLLDSLSLGQIQRVVLIGTAAEYGDQPTPFREDMEPRPLSHYAVSKVRSNEYALDLHERTGLPVTILRVFTAFGYGQPRKMFLSQLITHGLLNQQFKMSDGLQKRDFVYIDDVTTAILASLTAQKADGRIINIGSGRGRQLLQIANAVWNACGTKREFLEVGTLDKTGDAAFDTEADISLAREILDWSPTVEILDGSEPSMALLDTIRRIKHHLVPA